MRTAVWLLVGLMLLWTELGTALDFTGPAVLPTARMRLVQVTPSAPPNMDGCLCLSAQIDRRGENDPDVESMVTLYVDGHETEWHSGACLNLKLGTMIRLVTIPAADCAFVLWSGLPKSVAMKEVPAAMKVVAEVTGNTTDSIGIESDITFRLDEIINRVSAIFSLRPGIDKLDLVADFNKFLRETKLASSEEELVAFDKGGIEFEVNGHAAFVGDGLPDIAEFALVDGVLKARVIDFTETGGLSSPDVWEEYKKNTGALAKALPMASPVVQRAVAVYVMMSAKAHWWVVDMIKGKYGVDLKDAINGGEAQRWLEAEGDADKDGICNRDEWKQVVDRAPPGASLLAKLELFAEAALNPDIPQK